MDGLVEGACAQRVLYKIADSSLLYRAASRSTKFVVAQLRESLCNRGEWLMAVVYEGNLSGLCIKASL
jgi:hypothetical protein